MDKRHSRKRYGPVRLLYNRNSVIAKAMCPGFCSQTAGHAAKSWDGNLFKPWNVVVYSWAYD
jgi:hypothetical protein